MAEEKFTTAMKKATRKAHAASDALVNAKLLFALNSDEVWAEGLLIFYEIFKFLENTMKEKPEENFVKLYIPKIMNRTSAFEEDLAFYMGDDWKNKYKIRKSVQNYLDHLKSLLVRDSDLLMAYIYHLYMGLLSGGQILQKKREFNRKFLNSTYNSGIAVTSFQDVNISDVKCELRCKMNSIAENLNSNKKESLINESIIVFKLNNSILKTVSGAGKVAVNNILWFISIAVIIIGIAYCFFSQYSA